jgi:hypothetical protein
MPTLPLAVFTASCISIPVPFTPDIVFLFLTIEPGAAVCSVMVPMAAGYTEVVYNSINNTIFFIILNSR